MFPNKIIGSDNVSILINTMAELLDKIKSLDEFEAILKKIKELEPSSDVDLSLNLKKKPSYITEVKSRAKNKGVPAATMDLITLYYTMLKRATYRNDIEIEGKDPFSETIFNLAESNRILAESNMILAKTNREQWLKLSSDASAQVSPGEQKKETNIFDAARGKEFSFSGSSEHLRPGGASHKKKGKTQDKGN
ncbi:MAG: hypothetical protein J7599_07675 [Niabella sp.]|nr:hypothetical protein [Niabella sp.]